MKGILIFGTGGHCKSIIDIIESAGEHEIAGLIDLSGEYRVGDKINGYTIIGHLNSFKTDVKEYVGAVIAVGDNAKRNLIKDKILQINSDIRFITCIHKNASVSKRAEIGNGTVIMAGAVINNCKIGSDVIINSGAIIEHDCILEDFVTIAPNATLGGFVEVGLHSVVSIGATVINSVKIGCHTVIGAQALVVDSIGNNVVAYGVPAKVIRERQFGDNYLGR